MSALDFSPPGKEGDFVAVAYPCYAGPRDGTFYPKDQPPPGYKEFLIRGKFIWLWKRVDPSRLDFAVMQRASEANPDAYGNLGNL